MLSGKLRLLVAACAGAFTLWGCVAMEQRGGGMSATTAEGIPLGMSGPHPVQPLPDKPRFGHPVSEAELAAWNMDIRTPDGRGLPPGRGSVAEGKAIYAAKCVACHGADAKGGPMDRSHSLSANETYALAAYLLNLNGLVPTDAVMDSDSLPRVQMPNRDGFLIDDRPDTHAVRCMTDCK